MFVDLLWELLPRPVRKAGGSRRKKFRYRLLRNNSVTLVRVFYNHSHPIIMRLTHEKFRELAVKHGLAVTHQRQVVYEAVIASHGTIPPENIQPRSDATFHRFLSLRSTTICGCHRVWDAARGHSSCDTVRVDGNLKPHHHLVCSRCKSVQDIEGEFVDFKRLFGMRRTV